MKVVCIFVAEYSENGLWSIKLDNELQNEFDKFFGKMNDVKWLHDFFESNEADLTSGFFEDITIDEAVLRTLEEVQEMEAILYDYAEQGFTQKGVNLQHLFKPLNNYEYNITNHQKSKARIKSGWLRLYAIRLNKNCYLVTGGAIKLSPNMKRDHLEYELVKLERVKNLLCKAGIDYPEDLKIYYI